MEKYSEIYNVLNTPIDIDKETKGRRELLVEMFGASGYNNIVDIGYGDSLYETELPDYILDKSKDMFSSNYKTIAKVLGETVVVKMIQPIIKKLGIREYSFLWYAISYGLTDVAFELGENIFDSDKKLDFCRLFSGGAVVGVSRYFTITGMDKIMYLFGVNFAGNTKWLEPFILQSSGQVFDEFLKETAYNFVCGKNWDGDSLSGAKSLYDMALETISDTAGWTETFIKNL